MRKRIQNYAVLAGTLLFFMVSILLLLDVFPSLKEQDKTIVLVFKILFPTISTIGLIFAIFNIYKDSKNLYNILYKTDESKIYSSLTNKLIDRSAITIYRNNDNISITVKDDYGQFGVTTTMEKTHMFFDYDIKYDDILSKDDAKKISKIQNEYSSYELKIDDMLTEFVKYVDENKNTIDDILKNY